LGDRPNPLGDLIPNLLLRFMLLKKEVKMETASFDKHASFFIREETAVSRKPPADQL